MCLTQSLVFIEEYSTDRGISCELGLVVISCHRSHSLALFIVLTGVNVCARLPKPYLPWA